MIVRMSQGMDYGTAARNVQRAKSFTLEARVVEHEYDDGQFTFEVELRPDTMTAIGIDGQDMNIFITEVLRYSHICEVVGEWSDAP